MKKAGCGSKILGTIVLLIVFVWLVNSCIEKHNQARRAEEQRRASLTPEQRMEEDKKQAEEEAKRKRETELERRKIDAELYSKDYIRKFLKHPDDASFGFWDIPEIKWNEVQDTFYCSSKVKAKNDFGAELTYRWQTILTLNGNTWELVSCAIDGETVYESKELLNKLTARKQDKQTAIDREDAIERAKAEKERQAAIEEAKWRTWTDSTGKHKTEAKFGGVAFGKVKLIKRDGSTVQLPLEKLSDEDREWITNRSKMTGQ